MKRFSFSEYRLGQIFIALVGIVMAVSCVPDCRAAFISGDEYEIAKVSEVLFFKDIVVGNFSPQMKDELANEKPAHFLNCAFAREDICVKFSLSWEHGCDASSSRTLKLDRKVEILRNISGTYLTFRQDADVVCRRLATVGNCRTELESDIAALSTVTPSVYGHISSHLTRPEVALIFDDRPVCYDGFIDTGGLSHPLIFHTNEKV